MRNNREEYEKWFQKHATLTVDRDCLGDLKEISRQDIRSCSAELKFLINLRKEMLLEEQKQKQQKAAMMITAK